MSISQVYVKLRKKFLSPENTYIAQIRVSLTYLQIAAPIKSVILPVTNTNLLKRCTDVKVE